MAQPVWRAVKEQQRVPEPGGVQWTRVLDCAPVGKLIKIEVVVNGTANPAIPGTWKPDGYKDDCSADGDFTSVQPRPNPVMPGVPIGALIGRIGGSTSDQGLDGGVTPSRILFSVGRFCVIMVPPAPTGALFLGINDRPELMGKVQNQLIVNVYEAL
jgi:hypothetical protein